MRTLRSRIEQLEGRAGGARQTCIQLIVMQAGQELAIDTDRCTEILAECGYGSTAPISLLEFGDIPDGLDAAELERYLRARSGNLQSRIEEFERRV